MNYSRNSNSWQKQHECHIKNNLITNYLCELFEIFEQLNHIKTRPASYPKHEVESAGQVRTAKQLP